MLTILGQSRSGRPLFARRSLQALAWLLVAMSLQIQSSSFAAESLFAAPQPSTGGDEIFLISTRAIGAACNSQRMSQGLRCERFIGATTGEAAWQALDWRELLRDSHTNGPTVIYVHGNRVAPGRDLSDGLEVYRSLKMAGKTRTPVRYIIWSWPSTPIPGPVKDFRAKATLTQPVAWQFAWFLNQLPANSNLSLVGYSYGARVVSGAMHLLGGGHLGNLRLNIPHRQERSPVRAALIAAAYNETWIKPGNYYGRTIQVTDRLIVSTNKQDPAMRFYHLSNGRGRVHALGRAGVQHPSSLGAAANWVRLVDFSDKVGRSHSLKDYLAASTKMSALWNQLLSPGKERPTSKIASVLKMLPWIQ